MMMVRFETVVHNAIPVVVIQQSQSCLSRTVRLFSRRRYNEFSTNSRNVECELGADRVDSFIIEQRFRRDF